MLVEGFEPTGMSRLTAAMLFMLALLAVAPRTAVQEAIVDGLRVGFYNKTCPEAEGVVRDVVNSEVGMDRTIAAGLMRLFFHDCFVTVTHIVVSCARVVISTCHAQKHVMTTVRACRVRVRLMLLLS